MDGKESELVIMDVKYGPFKFESGQAYVSDYDLLGNAHCILIHLGVEFGPFDCFGSQLFVKV